MARKQAIAVDIGHHAVKVVAVERGLGGPRLAHVGAGEVHSASGGPGEVLDALRAAMRDAGIRGGDCVVSFPRSKVVLRRLTDLPSGLNATQLREVIQLQAVNQLPFPATDAVHDHLNVQSQASGASAELIAARLADVQEWLGPVREAGLRPVAVVPSVFGVAALARLERQADGSARERLAILDIGHETTDFTLLHEDSVVFSRSLPLGRVQLADSPASGLEGFMTELARTVERCARELGVPEEGVLESVWLLGGGSTLSFEDEQSTEVALSAVAESALHAPVSVAPYGTGWASLGPLDGVPWGKERFAIAMGLALGRLEGSLDVDLLPQSEQVKRAQAERTRLGVLYAVAALALVAGAYFVGGRIAAGQEAALTALDSELRRHRVDGSKATRTVAEMRGMSELLGPRHSVLDVMRELTALLPDRRSIALTSITIEESGKVTIHCEADTHEAISEAAAKIGRSAWFEDVTPGQITTVQRNDKQIRQCALAMKVVAASDVLAAKQIGSRVEEEPEAPKAEGPPEPESPPDRQG